MSFDVNPMSVEERKQQQLAHAQQMLNIINSLGSYSENPLPKYNYGGQEQQLNTDISKDFAASLLLASGGGRVGAMQRRLKKH
jgi:hypothetical protein